MKHGQLPCNLDDLRLTDGINRLNSFWELHQSGLIDAQRNRIESPLKTNMVLSANIHVFNQWINPRIKPFTHNEIQIYVQSLWPFRYVPADPHPHQRPKPLFSRLAIKSLDYCLGAWGFQWHFTRIFKRSSIRPWSCIGGSPASNLGTPIYVGGNRSPPYVDFLFQTQ